jgi:hypothetical protein
MSNASNELPVLNTSEWLQPETFEKMVRLGPAFLASLSKLKTMLSKGGGSKRDLKKLGTEIDELRDNSWTVCELISKANESHRKLVEALVGLASKGGTLTKLVPIIFGSVGNLNKVIKIVLAHETRLKALEASIVARKNKRGSAKKPLSPTSAKAHKKPRVRRV